jgi:hypothetical protein
MASRKRLWGRELGLSPLHLVHVNAANGRLLAAGGRVEIVHDSPMLEVVVFVLFEPTRR